ncbi:MAG: flagellar hook protein FlgE [Sphingopyxis sp.]|jgi:flagellar hook protein FlgE|nr:flagellar hook protein FlgE [Sphingopyxis sp.]
MSFFTSLSGLRGAQTELATVSNNVANVGTTGFKRSRVNFGDIMPPSQSSPGLGTQVQSISQQFTQGGFELSNRSLDLAISGNGFFMSRSESNGGQLLFSRNGALAMNAQRFLVDSSGGYMQVLPVDSTGATSATGVGAATSLQLPTTSGEPRATAQLSLVANLPRTVDRPALRSAYSPSYPYQFSPTDPNSYNFSQQTRVFDSTGRAIPATIYFVNETSTTAGDPADSWTARVYIGGQSATSTPINLAFGSDGMLTSPTGAVALDQLMPPGASSPLDISLTFSAGTQVNGGAFTVSGITQDGISPAALSDFSIGSDGLITANFADGTTQFLGRLALAEFTNPDGLKRQGDARWTATNDSGVPLLGTAGEAGLGDIRTGMLEQANVDLTEELVALISAQRNFQANAKALDTANQMTQSVINLRS